MSSKKKPLIELPIREEPATEPAAEPVKTPQLKLAEPSTHAGVKQPLMVRPHGKFPMKASKPIFDRAVCIITKDVNGVRVVVKSLVVATVKGFFRVGEHMFYVDITKAMFVSKKGPYLMYDLDITEPLDKPLVRGVKVAHAPVELGDNVHYSRNVDMVLHGEVIKQALKSVSDTSGFNWMWIFMLIIGAVMGFGFGVILGPNILKVGVSTTSSTAGMIGQMVGDLVRTY